MILRSQGGTARRANGLPVDETEVGRRQTMRANGLHDARDHIFDFPAPHGLCLSLLGLDLLKSFA
jgi:hypothetical protein